MDGATTPADALREAARSRAVTFVLGAGVSLPYGIPAWGELAARVWARSFPQRPAPWSAGSAEGEMPRQFLPIVFELARQRLGDRRFAGVLRACLYGDLDAAGLEQGPAAQGAPTTLGVLAGVLAAQVADPARHVARVVTFNADQLLEQAVCRAWRAAGSPRSDALGPDPVRLIARPSQQPADTLRGPIPVYHLHGVVPLGPADAPYARNYEHTLVFTDSQYWGTTTSLLSLPNTVMGTALHDSACVFVGLSMTDANILRWLALRSLEFGVELEQRLAHGRAELRRGVRAEVTSRLRRHFWIRPPGDDPSGLLSEFLEARGVVSVEIADWDGPAFGELLGSCFP